MEATLDINEFNQRRQKAQRNLMWLAIGSMVMVFAGLTSAYVVRRGAGDWFPIVLPQIFWVSSAVIVFSSLSMNFALQGFKKGNSLVGILSLGATLVLGLLFAWFQWVGWGELTRNGVYFVTAPGSTNLISGSFIYLLSGLHMAHLAGGILALLFTFVRALMGRYSPANLHGLRLCAIYWHFLDALWIYLFLFLTIFK